MRIIDHIPAIHTSGGIVSASSSGTTVTTGSSAHTKGSWTSIVDPIPAGVTSFWLVVQQAADSHRWAFDVGIGPSGGGSEIALIPDLWVGWKGEHGAFRVKFNLLLPAGLRLSARAQSSGTSAKNSYVSVILCRGGIAAPPPYGKVTAYGVTVSGATRGVEVDPGSSVDTKGSYSEIVASTANRIRQLYVSAGFPTSRSAATSPAITARAYFLADIAVGGSGSEVPRIADLPLAIDHHSDCVNGDPIIGPFDVDIPASSRLAVRMQSSTALDTSPQFDRRLDFVLYGVH
jgi:hypothetical protein